MDRLSTRHKRFPRERQTRLCACFFIASALSWMCFRCDRGDRFDTPSLATRLFYWKVRHPFRQSSVAHAPTPIPDVSTMVEKIDFTKSGATNEARQYAETITLEMCKHTAKVCGFITTEDTDPVNGNVSDLDPKVLRRRKQTDLNQFFFTLGVASLSGLRRRFYTEKLPEPFPGLTPLLHDRVSAILPRAEFVSVRHDHDPERFSSRRRGSRRLKKRQFSHARATGQPWSRRSTSRRAARRTRRGSTPRPSPWRCAGTPLRRAASLRRTRSPAKTTPSG